MKKIRNFDLSGFLMLFLFVAIMVVVPKIVVADPALPTIPAISTYWEGLTFETGANAPWPEQTPMVFKAIINAAQTDDSFNITKEWYVDGSLEATYSGGPNDATVLNGSLEYTFPAPGTYTIQCRVFYNLFPGNIATEQSDYTVVERQDVISNTAISITENTSSYTLSSSPIVNLAVYQLQLLLINAGGTTVLKTVNNPACYFFAGCVRNNITHAVNKSEIPAGTYDVALRITEGTGPAPWDYGAGWSQDYDSGQIVVTGPEQPTGITFPDSYVALYINYFSTDPKIYVGNSRFFWVSGIHQFPLEGTGADGYKTTSQFLIDGVVVTQADSTADSNDFSLWASPYSFDSRGQHTLEFRKFYTGFPATAVSVSREITVYGVEDVSGSINSVTVDSTPQSAADYMASVNTSIVNYDPEGPHQVELHLYQAGALVGIIATKNATASVPFSFDTKPYPAGEYELKLVVKDAASNTLELASQAVTFYGISIDPIAPIQASPSCQPQLANQIYYPGEKIYIAATSNVVQSLPTETLWYINGQPVHPGEDTAITHDFNEVGTYTVTRRVRYTDYPDFFVDQSTVVDIADFASNVSVVADVVIPPTYTKSSDYKFDITPVVANGGINFKCEVLLEDQNTQQRYPVGEFVGDPNLTYQKITGVHFDYPEGSFNIIVKVTKGILASCYFNMWSIWSYTGDSIENVVGTIDLNYGSMSSLSPLTHYLGATSPNYCTSNICGNSCGDSESTAPYYQEDLIYFESTVPELQTGFTVNLEWIVDGELVDTTTESSDFAKGATRSLYHAFSTAGEHQVTFAVEYVESGVRAERSETISVGSFVDDVSSDIALVQNETTKNYDLAVTLENLSGKYRVRLGLYDEDNDLIRSATGDDYVYEYITPDALAAGVETHTFNQEINIYNYNVAVGKVITPKLIITKYDLAGTNISYCFWWAGSLTPQWSAGDQTLVIPLDTISLDRPTMQATAINCTNEFGTEDNYVNAEYTCTATIDPPLSGLTPVYRWRVNDSWETQVSSYQDLSRSLAKSGTNIIRLYSWYEENEAVTEYAETVLDLLAYPNPDLTVTSPQNWQEINQDITVTAGYTIPDGIDYTINWYLNGELQENVSGDTFTFQKNQISTNRIIAELSYNNYATVKYTKAINIDYIDPSITSARLSGRTEIYHNGTNLALQRISYSLLYNMSSHLTPVVEITAPDATVTNERNFIFDYNNVSYGQYTIGIKLYTEEFGLNCPEGYKYEDTVTVNYYPSAPILSVVATQDSILIGESVTLTATGQTDWGTIAYKWFVNGIEQTGQTDATFQFEPTKSGNNYVMARASLVEDESSTLATDVTKLIQAVSPYANLKIEPYRSSSWNLAVAPYNVETTSNGVRLTLQTNGYYDAEGTYSLEDDSGTEIYSNSFQVTKGNYSDLVYLKYSELPGVEMYKKYTVHFSSSPVGKDVGTVEATPVDVVFVPTPIALNLQVLPEMPPEDAFTVQIKVSDLYQTGIAFDPSVHGVFNGRAYFKLGNTETPAVDLSSLIGVNQSGCYSGAISCPLAVDVPFNIEGYNAYLYVDGWIGPDETTGMKYSSYQKINLISQNKVAIQDTLINPGGPALAAGSAFPRLQVGFIDAFQAYRAGNRTFDVYLNGSQTPVYTHTSTSDYFPANYVPTEPGTYSVVATVAHLNNPETVSITEPTLIDVIEVADLVDQGVVEINEAWGQGYGAFTTSDTLLNTGFLITELNEQLTSYHNWELYRVVAGGDDELLLQSNRTGIKSYEFNTEDTFRLTVTRRTNLNRNLQETLVLNGPDLSYNLMGMVDFDGLVTKIVSYDGYNRVIFKVSGTKVSTLQSMNYDFHINTGDEAEGGDVNGQWIYDDVLSVIHDYTTPGTKTVRFVVSRGDIGTIELSETIELKDYAPIIQQYISDGKIGINIDPYIYKNLIYLWFNVKGDTLEETYQIYNDLKWIDWTWDFPEAIQKYDISKYNNYTRCPLYILTMDDTRTAADYRGALNFYRRNATSSFANIELDFQELLELQPLAGMMNIYQLLKEEYYYAYGPVWAATKLTDKRDFFNVGGIRWFIRQAGTESWTQGAGAYDNPQYKSYYDTNMRSELMFPGVGDFQVMAIANNKFDINDTFETEILNYKTRQNPEEIETGILIKAKGNLFLTKPVLDFKLESGEKWMRNFNWRVYNSNNELLDQCNHCPYYQLFNLYDYGLYRSEFDARTTFGRLVSGTRDFVVYFDENGYAQVNTEPFNPDYLQIKANVYNHETFQVGAKVEATSYTRSYGHKVYLAWENDVFQEITTEMNFTNYDTPGDKVIRARVENFTDSSVLWEGEVTLYVKSLKDRFDEYINNGYIVARVGLIDENTNQTVTKLEMPYFISQEMNWESRFVANDNGVLPEINLYQDMTKFYTRFPTEASGSYSAVTTFKSVHDGSELGTVERDFNLTDLLNDKPVFDLATKDYSSADAGWGYVKFYLTPTNYSVMKALDWDLEIMDANNNVVVNWNRMYERMGHLFENEGDYTMRVRVYDIADIVENQIVRGNQVWEFTESLAMYNKMPHVEITDNSSFIYEKDNLPYVRLTASIWDDDGKLDNFEFDVCGTKSSSWVKQYFMIEGCSVGKATVKDKMGGVTSIDFNISPAQ